MLKDKIMGMGDRAYYLFHRGDIGKVIFLNFLRERKGDEDNGNTVQFHSFAVVDYDDIQRHMDESLESLGVTSRVGTKAYVSDVKKALAQKFLSQEECVNMITHVLSVKNQNPAFIYGALERSVGSKTAMDMGGLICLYGGSGSGKTTFLDALIKESERQSAFIPVVVTSEPVARAVPLNRGLAELLCHIIAFEGASCIAFDSFRGIVYGSGGSTLSGGVSAAMLEITMNISRLASLCSKLVLGVINPLNVDEEKNATLVEALLGSTTGLVYFKKDNMDSVDFSHRFMTDRRFRSVSKATLIQHFARAELFDNTPGSATLGAVAHANVLSSIEGPNSDYRLDADIEEQLGAVTFNQETLPTVKF